MTASFTVTVQDPCPSFAEISVPGDYTVTYAISSSAMTIDYTAGYSVVRSITSADMEYLCGPIMYTVDSSTTSAEIVDSGDPGHSLTVYSEDFAGMSG